MKINKIYIICSLILFTGCKKNITGIEKDNTKDTTKIQKHEDTSVKENRRNGFSKESFVISCGSGCAMSYSPENIEQLNDKSTKVKFNVDMYVDEVVTDTYKETYIFSYGSSGEVEKINPEGKNENVLETLMPDAQESFRDFGNRLLMKADINVKIKTNCIKGSNLKLPYNTKINLKTVKYEKLTCSIKGIEKFICDQEKLRYIALPQKDDVNVILVPQDCGDFSYRFYLLTIKNNTVVDNLYVEGEWYEPDDEENKEVTSFSIDDKYNIIVKVQTPDSGISEKYVINNDGKIKKQ